MDLSSTIIPKSDQINAEDLLTGPVTVTVESVTGGNAEQPVNIHLVEYPGRAYRPSKTMRRVIIKAWGKESDAYIGRRMTLYRDPDVKWGGIKVGGIKVSHFSHIARGFSLSLTETKGKRVAHTVEVLDDVQAPAKLAGNLDVSTITDRDVLKDLWRTADQQTRAAIKARVDQLDAAPADDPLDYSGDLLDEGGAL